VAPYQECNTLFLYAAQFPLHYTKFVIFREPLAHIKFFVLLAQAQWIIGITGAFLFLCFLLRGGLLTVWYARHGGLCRNNVSQQPIMHRSFICVIYSLCTIVRAFQYVLLAKGFITFVNVQSKYCCAKELCCTMKHWCYIGTLILLALSLQILSLAVPVIGIIMETNHNHKHCEDHDKVIFIGYCVFDIFSYLSETFVRLLMIVAAIEVNRIWLSASASLKEVHTDETENESTNQIIEDWTASSDTHQALSRQYEKVASKLNNLVKYSRHGLYCPG